MRNPHASESFSFVVLSLAVLVIAPAVLTDSVIAALTATPLRQAVSVFVASITIGAGLLWAVSPFVGNAVEQASAKRTWGQGGDE